MRLWYFWRIRRSDSDFANEVESHIALEIDRLVESGMPLNDARHSARRAFGNTTSVKEHFHERHSASRWEWLVQDTRYAFRRMKREPGFTIIVVLSLALGIGANTTMFGAVDALLFRTPAHVRDGDRIQRLYFTVPTRSGPGEPSATTGYRAFVAMQDRVPAFESVAAYWSKTISSGRDANARPLETTIVSTNFFTTLGVQPTLGRFFSSSERATTDRVAVISYEQWRSQFNGDRTVLGQTIDVAGELYTIIGVAPPAFTGVNLSRVDIWLPIGSAERLMARSALFDGGTSYWWRLIAKRNLNATVERATAEVTNVYREIWRDEPRYDESFAKATALVGPVIEARGPAAAPDARVATWIVAVSLLVLMIASANVANLFLLRGLMRQREAALRLSLGATRTRLMRQSFVEGALFSLFGAVGAIMLANWTVGAMHAFLLPDALKEGIFNVRLLAFTAITAIGAALLSSVVPAFVAAQRSGTARLGSSRIVRTANNLMLQRILIAFQVSLATVLVVASALFVTSLRNVQRIDLGLDVEHLMYVKLDLKANKLLEDAKGNSRRAIIFETILRQLRQLPGVASASATDGEPLASGWGVSLSTPSIPEPASGTPVPFGRAVSTDYFETMGTRLSRGRFFTGADHRADSHVAIVDDMAAKQFWPSGDVVGSCVRLGSEKGCTTIVGVVRSTVQWTIIGDKIAIVYVPIEAWPDHQPSMIEVRTVGDPAKMVDVVRNSVGSASAGLPWATILSLGEWLSPQLKSWRLGASMFTAYGVLAIGLAAIGLYGLLSYVVAQRTHEIGIRKALGALNVTLVNMVLRWAITMTVAGLIVGVLLSFGANRYMAKQLYGVSPRDPFAIVGGALLLLVVAVLASVVPARRASRVDPMEALRMEN
ncbi:MAG: ADOP family duplicated permease [Gemmatimonadaceae bacterium]